MAHFKNHNQALLSEQLLLLHEFDYPDYSPSQNHVSREMKLLNTIALLLSTGLPGDHFAAAFDKREGLEVVLAKNGTPNAQDVADARELFSSLCNPEINKGSDLFPFVARRCRANVLKRIQKLRASVIDREFCDVFYSRLDQRLSARNPLSPSDIKLEFFEDTDYMMDYIGDPLTVALRDLLNGTTKATAAVSEALDVSEFMDVYILASILARSHFLWLWIRAEDTGYQKVQRFQRRTEKLCRYFDDVRSLVQHAKRLGGPIKYRWVTDESLGVQVGEEDICIHAETPQEAVHRASVLSAPKLAELKERKPSIVEPWKRTVHTCLHAELRIILHFGQSPGMTGLRPIGLSKRSCLCCVLWMTAYNRRGNIYWKTKSHNKPDATWALTASACPNVQDRDLRALDEKVVSGVFRRLEGQLQHGSVTELMNMRYEFDEIA